MVLRIGNVKGVAVKCHSLRSKESCAIKGSIIRSVRARADGFNQSSVELRDYDAIVIRVGNEKAIALRVGQDFAGKSQRQITNLRAFKHKFQWRFIQLAAFAKLRNRIADSFVERFVTAFAGQPANNVAGRIDQISGRPGVDRIRIPDRKVGIVHHRMLDLVTQNDAANVLGLLFIREFCRMHADDYQLVWVLALEPLQIGDDVHAVDAAVSPEVEQHDFALQRRER